MHNVIVKSEIRFNIFSKISLFFWIDDKVKVDIGVTFIKEEQNNKNIANFTT